MVSRKLYAILGIVCGFILIDYGFSFLSVGLPGARELTSQFVGGSFAIGGSAAVFISLFSILSTPHTATPTPTSGSVPDVLAETIVEEETGSQYGFYRNIEYVGYFFTALGLFSAADLVMQVFVHQLYNETRWWIEVLLVTFGVLSYAIFGSLGRIGAQEEKEMASHIPQSTQNSVEQVRQPATAASPDSTQIPATIQIRLADFVKSTSGDYEHHLSGRVYDMIRIQHDMVTIWREERQEIRAIYLAGPYELTREHLEEQLKRGEELKVGIVSIPVDAIRDLLKPQSTVSTSA